jgi:hypothetical protein
MHQSRGAGNRPRHLAKREDNGLMNNDDKDRALEAHIAIGMLLLAAGLILLAVLP